MRNERARGVTLIELLVVVAIAGLLLSIAVPSYRGYLLRANRTEARTALLALAAAQEKLYLQCHTYATTLDPDRPTACSPVTLRFAARTERGYYAIAVTAADTDAWVATATRAAGTAQSADRMCRVLELRSSGEKSARDDADVRTDRECWDR
jgi:type IV pilus assembly protein PilE